MEVNKYQTPLTDEYLNSLIPEVKDQLLDFIGNVEFIRRLISPDRKYARDLPRDELGRIKVDIVNPHILEDMDYFRPTALHFKKYGTVTNLRPNATKGSEFYKWLEEEVNRCWNGYVRESDGEWITGNMYFYLNYTPITQTVARKNKKVGDRIVDFPKVWEGIYLRFHYIDQARNGGIYNNFEGGNHGAELASRGVSKSYTLASILAKIFILGESKESHIDNRAVVAAYAKEYLTKDGTLSKFTPILDHCASHTQFPYKRLRSSQQNMSWKMGYVDLETLSEKGTKNEVIGVSVSDDVSKLRGKRTNFLGIEEFGSFPTLLGMYNTLLPSVQDGDLVFGLLYILGTSGDKESDFAGAKEILYNPRGYNIYALPNVYDKNALGKGEFTFFFPGFLNRAECYNENGVTDIIKSLVQILNVRHRVKYNSSDPNTIIKTIAEIPITPSEAILKVKNNSFPTAAINARLEELDLNPSEYDDVYVGELVLKGGVVEFRPTSDLPIRDFPSKDLKATGAVEIYKLPEKDKDGKIYPNRYIASHDPFDDDSVTDSVSLGSTFIFDLWTDDIVAEYTGRPEYADDSFEIARKLCLMYNARLNYENNKKGLFAYFSKMNSLYLLTDVLDFLKDKDMIKGVLYGNKAKGTIASAPINDYARTLIKDWLLKPITITQIIDGEKQEVTVHKVSTIRNRALLKELVLWNNQGNFDRVSSLGMLMLLRQEKLIQYGEDPINTVSTGDNLAEDKFFTVNYPNKSYID